MAVEIRDQTSDDDAAVRIVVTRAFGDDGQGAALAEALRARADAGAALVAIDGGHVVGHVQLSISWVDAPDRLVEVLTLSPLTVTPTSQSRGIGGQLLAAATDRARQMSAPLLFLEGDPGYYSRHGWRAAAGLGFTPPSARIPPAAFQVFVLPGYDPTAMHGALVYNDTFWAQDCVGLRG